jgi:transposase
MTMVYHKGPGVKKSGPKGPRKIKGKVLDALLDELERHPADPSHIIAQRVTAKTHVQVASRTVRKVRHRAGEKGSSRPSSREANHPRSPRMSSYPS